MKSVFRVKQLASAVQSVLPAVGVRSPHAGFKMLKLTFGPITTIAATDGEVSIVRQIPDAIVEADGSALFPPEKLSAILRETIAEEITIEAVEGIAHIKSGSSRFKIPLEVAAEFPESPVWDAVNYYSVSCKDMEAIAGKSCFCDPKHKVPSIAGVAFDVAGGELNAMSTDSKCLIVIPAKCEKHGEPEEFCVPVPMKSVKLIGGILDGDRVGFAATKNAIVFRTSLSVVSTQLLFGKVIGWRKQFNDPAIHSMSIVPEIFARSVRMCQITTSEESKRVLFHFDGGTLRMKSSAASAGESAVEMPIQFEGDIKASLIPDGLLTALKMFDDASVEFCLTADDGPIRIHSESGVRFVQAQCQKDE